MRPHTPQELDDELEGYISGVLGGTICAGHRERQAVQRHVRDLERGPGRGLRWNNQRARRACWWIENNLVFTKSKWYGKPFLLQPWQIFIVYSLFGWECCGSDGAWRLRFRIAYLSVSRKNGKTELGAAIDLLMLITNGASMQKEYGAEVYIAATGRKQAALAWRAAARMIRKSKRYKRDMNIPKNIETGTRFVFTYDKTESRFEAVASDGGTLDGPNPVVAHLDEYHEHKTSTVADTLISGMLARTESLRLYTTTAGGKRAGPCWDLEHSGLMILDGIGEEEGSGDDLFCYVCTLDEGDDPFDEDVWRKAAPNLGVTVTIDNMRLEARAAKRDASKYGEFRRKNCNVWTETAVGLGAGLLKAWDECPPLIEIERGARCYPGVDLSVNRDYTAAAAVFPLKDGTYQVELGCWIPLDTAIERSRIDRVPVMAWIEKDIVDATPGDVVDQEATKQWLLNLRERAEIVEIPMDPAHALKLQTELRDLGMPVLSFGQGWATMSPAIQEWEKLILQKKIRHGNNPVLRWMMGNVALRMGPTGNRMFDKKRSGDRIDGVVALAMGLARAAADTSGSASGSVRAMG